MGPQSFFVTRTSGKPCRSNRQNTFPRSKEVANIGGSTGRLHDHFLNKLAIGTKVVARYSNSRHEPRFRRNGTCSAATPPGRTRSNNRLIVVIPRRAGICCRTKWLLTRSKLPTRACQPGFADSKRTLSSTYPRQLRSASRSIPDDTSTPTTAPNRRASGTMSRPTPQPKSRARPCPTDPKRSVMRSISQRMCSSRSRRTSPERSPSRPAGTPQLLVLRNKGRAHPTSARRGPCPRAGCGATTGPSIGRSTSSLGNR